MPQKSPAHLHWKLFIFHSPKSSAIADGVQSAPAGNFVPPSPSLFNFSRLKSWQERVVVLAKTHLFFTILLSLGLASVLLLSGCGQSGCSSDKQCKAWQSCDVAKKSCVLKPGFCGIDSECNDTLKFCSGTDHKCTYVKDKCRQDVDCEGWQLCDEDSNTCRPKAGFCGSDDSCNTDREICHPTRHVCSPKPGTCNNQYDCDAWQTCNTGTHLCVPLAGRCSTDVECNQWQTCDTGAHNCVVRAGFCNNDLNCAQWQVCNPSTHRCVAGTNNCERDEDCSSWELCNNNTHACEAKRGLCSSLSDCGTWQICDVSNRRCVSKPGFCSSDSECGSWQKCDAAAHTCNTRVGYCSKSSDCKFDERCETDPRSPSAYRCIKITCGKDEDCPGSTCDPQTQRCRGAGSA